MIRAVRRTLRSWRRDFLAFYMRFNTFYRIVIGIVLAMGIVAGSRHFLLDPKQREIRSVESRLTKETVPETVPSIETDD